MAGLYTFEKNPCYDGGFNVKISLIIYIPVSYSTENNPQLDLNALFPFPLDDFQHDAITALDDGKSVRLQRWMMESPLWFVRQRVREKP
ncbi:MAG: hypothetical protein RLZZ532_1661 [Cyanobacteriota bacterium]